MFSNYEATAKIQFLNVDKKNFRLNKDPFKYRGLGGWPPIYEKFEELFENTE